MREHDASHPVVMKLPEIILTRELTAIGMDRQLRLWLESGVVRRMLPGAYVRVKEFAGLTVDERYRLLIAATALIFPENQFSHDSAAALWRLPSIGAWPEVAHALAPRGAGGRSKKFIVRHCIGLDLEPLEIDGVTTTSLTRTLADLACQPSFGRAVAMLDDGFRTPIEGDWRFGIVPPTKSEVLALLEDLLPVPGHARARRAIEFADAASGSAGESLSRVQFRALGLPSPQLQVKFYDYLGYIGTVDFYWPELGLIGEFDGHSKYGDARRFARHLSAQEVVVAEKEREDRLRAVSNDFVRWNWQTALHRPALGALMASHGLLGARSTRR